MGNIRLEKTYLKKEDLNRRCLRHKNRIGLLENSAFHSAQKKKKKKKKKNNNKEKEKSSAFVDKMSTTDTW